MNILHLRASNFYGGPERQLHYHSKQACNSEFHIILGSFSEKGKTPEFLDIIGADSVETVLFEVKDAYDYKAIEKLRTYLQECKISNCR